MEKSFGKIFPTKQGNETSNGDNEFFTIRKRVVIQGLGALQIHVA